MADALNKPMDQLKGVSPETLTFFRPAEIKTYHKQPYDRISPSKTFDGKGKTVLVTAGGA